MIWIWDHITLLFIVFILLAPVLGIGWSVTYGAKRRFTFLANYVQARGYQFVNSELARIPETPALQMLKTIPFKNMQQNTAGITDIREFEGSSASDGFWLTDLGKHMTIFAHTHFSKNSTYTGGSDSRHMSAALHMKVAKVQCENLPVFRLEKRSVVTTVETVVDAMLKLGGVSVALKPVGLQEYPEFLLRYRLVAENEDDAKRFFSPVKIATLQEATLSGTVTTNANYLVYYEAGKFTNEGSYDEFIVRAKAAVEILLR